MARGISLCPTVVNLIWLPCLTVDRVPCSLPSFLLLHIRLFTMHRQRCGRERALRTGWAGAAAELQEAPTGLPPLRPSFPRFRTLCHHICGLCPFPGADGVCVCVHEGGRRARAGGRRLRGTHCNTARKQALHAPPRLTAWDTPKQWLAAPSTLHCVSH